MIVVVGSLNMDLVVRVPRHPQPGETLLGSAYETHPGGKGANQAVAAARAGGRVVMIGRVGQDAFGQRLREGLQQDGIDASAVLAVAAPTGVAFIAVDEAGQNSIIVSPGANATLTEGDLTAAQLSGEALFAGAKVVLLQLETPLESVLAAARLGRAAGAMVILNLAPAQALTAAQLRDVDLLLVNESEAAALLNVSEAEVNAQPEAAAAKLLALVPRAVITLGARGAAWADRRQVGLQPAFAVRVVDTTAAGDAFAGALAVALAGGKTLAQAVRFAAAAGALAVTKVGAQPSLPSRAEIAALLDPSESERSENAFLREWFRGGDA